MFEYFCGSGKSEPLLVNELNEILFKENEEFYEYK